MVELNDIECWVRPTGLFDEGKLIADTAVGIAGQKVQLAVPADQLPSSAKIISFDGILSRGFVDLQVNGGGGVLVNERPTKKAIWEIARAHRAYGTTGILPTVITDAADVLEQAVDAAIDAFGHHGVLGLHIEGPHISEDRRGTHKAEFVRPLDDRTIALVASIVLASLSLSSPQQYDQLVTNPGQFIENTLFGG